MASVMALIRNQVTGTYLANARLAGRWTLVDVQLPGDGVLRIAAGIAAGTGRDLRVLGGHPTAEAARAR